MARLAKVCVQGGRTGKQSGAWALPSWSWDTLQTYVHCANYTGEWNDEALAILAKQPFVVFEKYHKAFEAPQFDGAEAKIAESCRRVKALNPKTDCYIYTESVRAAARICWRCYM